MKVLITAVPFGGQNKLPLELLDISGVDYLINPCNKRLKLLERKIKDSNKVNMFPVHEYWLDIGQTEQLHQAQKDVSIL